MSFFKKMLILFGGIFTATLCILGLCKAIQSSVYAEENKVEPNLKIERNNLSYSSELFILYAVSYNEGFDYEANPVSMLFFEANQSGYTKNDAKEETKIAGTSTLDGNKVLIFYSPGIAAKRMIDDVYARAYVSIDGEEYYSDIVRFSVLEYVYKMRTQEDLSDEQKELFDNLLGYGGAAQNLFGYKTDTLVTDVYYTIDIEGGCISEAYTNTFNHGLYKKGTTVTIETYGDDFKYWKTNYGEIIKSSSYSFKVERDTTFTAVRVAPWDKGSYQPETIDIAYNNMYSMTNEWELTAYHNEIQDMLPTSITLSLKDISTAANVSWDISNFTGKTIGENKIYGTLENQNLYDDYNLEEEDIFICLNVLPYTFREEMKDGETYYIITRYYGCESNLELPSSYNGVLVNKIEVDDWCSFQNHDELYSLSIPATYEEIPVGTFRNCANLTYVNLEKGLESIGEQAFLGCESLKFMEIPNSVKTIGEDAFSNCYSLESVFLPEGITELNCFKYCKRLMNINIPSTVTTIGGFNDCYLLKNIEMPKNLSEIQSRAFMNCSNLYVDIPDSVTSIGDEAFNGCKNIKNVVISENVTSIGAGAFANCSIESISVSLNNTKYDSRNGCNAIIDTQTGELIAGCYNTEIPSTVSRIGDEAFMGCYNLKNLYIPTSVASIGLRAFSYCSLESISVASDNATLSSKSSNAIFLNDILIVGCKNTVIPESGCNQISNYAFEGVKGLYSIHIPSSVMVENYAFLASTINEIYTTDELNLQDYHGIYVTDSSQSSKIEKDGKYVFLVKGEYEWDKEKILIDIESEEELYPSTMMYYELSISLDYDYSIGAFFMANNKNITTLRLSGRMPKRVYAHAFEGCSALLYYAGFFDYSAYFAIDDEACGTAISERSYFEKDVTFKDFLSYIVRNSADVMTSSLDMKMNYNCNSYNMTEVENHKGYYITSKITLNRSDNINLTSGSTGMIKLWYGNSYRDYISLYDYLSPYLCSDEQIDAYILYNFNTNDVYILKINPFESLEPFKSA